MYDKPPRHLVQRQLNRESLLARVERVFGTEINYDPGDYKNLWQRPDAPMHEHEEMELYLDLHRSPFDVEFPWCGVAGVPIWGEVRMAASLCYIVLEHPSIEISNSSRLDDLEEFAIQPNGQYWELESYLSLSEAEWQTFFVVLWYAISPTGPVRRWYKEAGRTCHGLRRVRQALMRMSLARNLSEIDNQDIAEFVWLTYYNEKKELNEFEWRTTHPLNRNKAIKWH